MGIKKYIGKLIDNETNETLFTTVIKQVSYKDACVIFNSRVIESEETFDNVGKEGFAIEVFIWKNATV